MLPSHGKIVCTECFGGDNKRQAIPHPEWRMINDPGAWGSHEPRYLVLGFSKGATQAGIYDTARFEDVAFAGMRSRLTTALHLMGILAANESADDKIGDPNSEIAFGSLIRCSVSRIDRKASQANGVPAYSCTGPLITKSFSEIPDVISNCSRRYLSNLPASVEVVFFLGNGDEYVSCCQKVVAKLFPGDYKQINPMAVSANGRLWVHLAHPSRLNGHFKTWAAQTTGPGAKRIQAQQALSTNPKRREA